MKTFTLKLYVVENPCIVYFFYQYILAQIDQLVKLALVRGIWS